MAFLHHTPSHERDLTSTLPVEVLGSIFADYHEDATLEHRSQPFLKRGNTMPEIVLSSVCSRWRGVAAQTKEVWSAWTIQLFHPNKDTALVALEHDKIATYLERSKGLPLDVKLFAPETMGGMRCTTRDLKMIESVAIHAARMESLMIATRLEKFRHVATHIFQKCSFPRLKHLSIEASGITRSLIPGGLRGRQYDFCLPAIPALKSLRLRHVPLWLFKAPSTVEVVDIDGHQEHTFMSDIFGLLKAANASITDLTVNNLPGGWNHQFPAGWPSARARMESLRTLKMDRTNQAIRIDSPTLVELHIAETVSSHKDILSTLGIIPWISEEGLFGLRNEPEDPSRRKLQKATFRVSFVEGWSELFTYVAGVRSLHIREGSDWIDDLVLEMALEPLIGSSYLPSLRELVLVCTDAGSARSAAKSLLDLYQVEPVAGAHLLGAEAEGS